MKKLLYISVNSKSENESSSKTVARTLINKIIENEECEIEVEEFDVYKEHIPTLTHEYFCGRNTLCSKDDYEELNHRARNEIDRIKALSEQFSAADIYVVAAPMWSLLFPAPLKQYLDCVIQNGINIKISENKCEGLLDDKERKFYFVQSSGGDIPIVFKGMPNHSSCYLKDIVKFLGISKYKEILVDGTGFTEEDKRNAIEDAKDQINSTFKISKAIDKACEMYKKDSSKISEKVRMHKECKEENKKEISEEDKMEKNENGVESEKIEYSNDLNLEPEEEITEEKKETYEKMENDSVLNEESAKEYN